MGFKGTEIPDFIKAQSPMGLRRLMLKNNAALGGFVHYFNIQYVQEPNQKPYWIVWFFKNVENSDPIFNPKAGE